MKPYYQDDFATIYHADNLTVMPNLPKFDLLCTDPPYGIGEGSKRNASRGTSSEKWKRGGVRNYGIHEWDESPASAEQIEMARGMAKWQLIFGGNYFHLPPTKCWLVWDKLNTGDFADCELAWTNFQKAVRRIAYLWNGMMKAKPEERYHPTQKPFAVMQWCIKQAPADVISVIDPWCGSGTTLCAAKSIGLISVGIERDESSAEISAKRCAATEVGSVKAVLEKQKDSQGSLID